MVFSSFATVLSANSARVSAFGKTIKHINHPDTASYREYSLSRNEHTSLSLSFRTLISSSYLSSFSEYYRNREIEEDRHVNAKTINIRMFVFVKMSYYTFSCSISML